MHFTKLGTWCALCLSAAGCGGDDAGSGTVRINLQAEVTITDGLSTGPDQAQSKDYAVSYSKYLVVIGNIQLGESRSGQSRSAPGLYLADLKQVGEQGLEIAKFDDVPAGRWDKFSFETPAAQPGLQPLGQISSEDLAKMIENGWTYWIEGTVAATNGPVRFVVQAATPTRFDSCGLDGKPGLAVVASATKSSNITLHGDHLWFNAFPTAEEGTVERRAAWIVEADRDHDGSVTTADLALLNATEVFTTQLGYRLDGAPIAIRTALDFVRAQLATQGHFEGEGECIWHFEGATGG